MKNFDVTVLRKVLEGGNAMEPLFEISSTGVLLLAGFAVIWIAFVLSVEYVQKKDGNESKDQV